MHSILTFPTTYDSQYIQAHNYETLKMPNNMKLTEFITRWLHPLPLAGERVLRFLKQQLSKFRANNAQWINLLVYLNNIHHRQFKVEPQSQYSAK